MQKTLGLLFRGIDSPDPATQGYRFLRPHYFASRQRNGFSPYRLLILPGELLESSYNSRRISGGERGVDSGREPGAYFPGVEYQEHTYVWRDRLDRLSHGPSLSFDKPILVEHHGVDPVVHTYGDGMVCREGLEHLKPCIAKHFLQGRVSAVSEQQHPSLCTLPGGTLQAHKR